MVRVMVMVMVIRLLAGRCAGRQAGRHNERLITLAEQSGVVGMSLFSLIAETKADTG
jgi:hypothetical protein